MSIRMKMTFTVILLTSAIACGSYTSPTSPTPTTASATIVSGAFMPDAITISTGSTVTWTNSDSTAHAVVADGAEFDSGTIEPGAKFSHVFPSAGTFVYHDAANPSIKGTVNVSASAPPSPY